MSEQSTIHYERTSPQVAKITFANPPVNLIVGETVLRLTEIVEKLATDPDIQVVVFDSATPDFFYNHFDLAAAADFPAPRGRERSAGLDEPGPGPLQSALHHHRGHPRTHPRRRERTRPRPRSAVRQPGEGDLRAAGGGRRTAPRRWRHRTPPPRHRTRPRPGSHPHQRRLRRRHRRTLGLDHPYSPRQRTRRLRRHDRRPARLLRPHLTRVGQGPDQPGIP